MGKVSLDNCREMHRRYEKNFMEKAGRNIRKSSCLRNNTDQNQTKKDRRFMRSSYTWSR